MKNKKGQLGELVPIITTLIVIGLLLGAGFLIVEKFRDDDSLKDTSATVTNESNGYINETGYTLAGASVTAFNSVVISSAYNNTDDLIILSGNYTVSSLGVVTNASTDTWEDVNISYTYKYGEGAWKGANSTIEALTTVPDLLGLIILIVMVGIILAIVFNVIPTGRVSGA